MYCLSDYVSRDNLCASFSSICLSVVIFRRRGEKKDAGESSLIILYTLLLPCEFSVPGSKLEMWAK